MSFFTSSRSIPLLFALVVLAGATDAANAQAPASPAPQSATEKSTSHQDPVTVQPPPVLEPKAIEILKAACARLAAAHSMEFTAVETFENPSRLGFPLAYGTKSDVLLQRSFITTARR